MEGIEQGRSRNLRRGVGRTRTCTRRGRINRHALVHETHGGGGGRGLRPPERVAVILKARKKVSQVVTENAEVVDGSSGE